MEKDVYDSDKYKVVPEKLKTKHRFCGLCGCEMRYSRTIEKTMSFDRATGKKLEDVESFSHKWLCPQACEEVEFEPV
jgi:hypothetical protein